MITNKNIRIVKEDSVIGNGCNKCEKLFGDGHNNFQYPYTVSFCSEGEYSVKIKGREAVVEKIS